MWTFGRTALITLLALAPAVADAQVRQRDPAATFDGADSNKDGQISRAEYLAARDSRFAQMDKDHNGVIERADFPRADRWPQLSDRLNAMIAEADADKDNKVTRAELAKAPAPIFDKADANHDGSVSKAELAALRAAHGG
ncbi:hypothetical protein ACFB49_48540 [Sphingomonas sp. DBB INV C78]|uniref:EF-hand domain-containing protein n=1 Tax=Sphingomonas sp. DBB INV C78 TaxID=3349434 RepID=UPI0036D31D5E